MQSLRQEQRDHTVTALNYMYTKESYKRTILGGLAKHSLLRFIFDLEFCSTCYYSFDLIHTFGLRRSDHIERKFWSVQEYQHRIRFWTKLAQSYLYAYLIRIPEIKLAFMRSLLLVHTKRHLNIPLLSLVTSPVQSLKKTNSMNTLFLYRSVQIGSCFFLRWCQY